MTTIDEPTTASSQSTFVPPTPSISEIVRRDLSSALGNKVLSDDVSRGLYATDASVYQFMPVAVVVPEDEDDIRTVLEIARKYHVPVLPRGGGTSLAGQTANHAVVLDISKNMNRILEVNPDEKWVRIQPGLVRDELNAAMAEFGLEFGPETSTSDRANIGGMIGNNSSGMRSIRYGRTLESVLECRLMLPNGEVLECKPRSQAEIKELAEGDTEEGKIWRGLLHLLEHHRSLIEQKFPKVLRRVGGYSLDEFPENKDWNLAKLIGGSEGTLGIMLDAKLKLVETPNVIKMVAVHFEDLIDGLRSVPKLMQFNPLSAEVLDGAMIKLSQNNPSTADLCDFVVGEPGLILQVEIDAETEEACIKKLDEFEAFLKDNNVGYAYPRFITKQQADRLLDLRKKGLGVSLSVPGDTKPVSWIEDACVPIEHLADYTDRVLKAATERGLNTVVYGHASVGVLHIKPALNLKTKKGLADMAALSKIAMEFCREYGGSWSGEHGDGVARGAQNMEFWGQEIMEVFRQLKGLFDPIGLMNPARIINSPAVNENLRYGTEYEIKDADTVFNYRDFGGFAPAVEMCNGVGACRKTLSGTMCPSYMVTRNEQESTRGRANALRLAMSGQLDGGLTNERLHEVLDLCLECKACKSECPSNVDMSRLKSDHLAKYYEKHGPSLRDRVFAHTPTFARLAAGPLAFFVNAPMKIKPLKKVLLRTLGIAEERNLPFFSSVKLETWAKKRKPSEGKNGEVVLFADCWSNYNELAPGKWGIKLLEHLGYKVTLVGDACCQRTRISKGFLADAKRGGTETLKKLKPYAEKGVPILGIEPSCMSSLTDDLPDLVNDEHVELAKKVAALCSPVEAFIAKEVEEGRLTISTPKRPAAKILVHGHCHQKAIYSTAPAKMLLAIGGAEVSEVDSGCCGMAGSFGYEAEHYDISQKMAERKLLPEIRKQDDDTIIVANGFSCRHQINDFGDKKTYHTIEALARQITGNWHTD